MVEVGAESPVARAEVDGESPARIRDWALRLFEASPFPLPWTGLALVAAYFALALAFRAAVSAFDPSATTPLPWIWELVNGLLIALPLTLNAYARRAALADLRCLAPSLGSGGAELASLRDFTTTPPHGWLAAVSGASVAVMAGFVLFDPWMWGPTGRPGPGDPTLWWAFFRNAASAYAFGRMLAMEAVLTRGYARIAERVRIDLLDQRALAPLARKGQRSAILWVLVSSCVSLFWFGGQPALINGFVLALALGVVATAFALPLSRVRRRIVAAKQAELLRVKRSLEQERESLLAGGTGPGGRVADLLAWRALIEDVREWPVGLPTLLRSGLFVLLGIGSWLGGAVVERILETLLPR